jgi:hypothetical protein
MSFLENHFHFQVIIHFFTHHLTLGLDRANLIRAPITTICDTVHLTPQTVNYKILNGF